MTEQNNALGYKDLLQNRFLLSIAVAKRARQIQEGEKPLIPLKKDEQIIPIIVALEEIKKGKILVFIRDNDENEVEILEKLDKQLDADIDKQKEEEALEKEKEKEKKKASKSKAKKSLMA